MSRKHIAGRVAELRKEGCTADQIASRLGCVVQVVRLVIEAQEHRRRERRAKAVATSAVAPKAPKPSKPTAAYVGFTRLTKPSKNRGPMSDAGAYLPTPEQIREECEAIQAGWSNAERRWRYLAARTINNVSGLYYSECSFPSFDQSQLSADFTVG